MTSLSTGLGLSSSHGSIPSLLRLACLAPVLFLSMHSSSLRAESGHRIPVLDSIERRIGEGRLYEARKALAECGRMNLSMEAEAWRKVLVARALHDGGDFMEASRLLRGMIDEWRLRPSMGEVTAEALLEYARACRSLVWLERMHAAVDSVAVVAQVRGLPDHLRMRYFIHKAMYFSIMIQLEKAKPFLDSMTGLLDRMPASQSGLYQSLLANSVLITYYRNADYPKSQRMVDSLMPHMTASYSGSQSYGAVMLLKAMANHCMDRVIYSTRGSPEWRRSALSMVLCFDRGLALLAGRFPTNHPERLNLFNLKGLGLYNIGRYGDAMQNFMEAESILGMPSYPIRDYTYMHHQTTLYSLRCIDSVYSGKELRAQRLRLLARCRSLSAVWDRWEETNRDSLGHYRLHYTTDPGHIMVELCQRLYAEERDPALLELALQGMEDSKFRYLRRRMMARAGISVAPEVRLRTIQSRLASDEAVICVSAANQYMLSLNFLVITPDTVAMTVFDKGGWAMHRYEYGDGGLTACRDLASFKDTYHTLYKLMFRRLETFLLKSSRVLVIPSGQTSVLPFDILVPDTAGVRDFGSLPLLRDRFHFRYDYSLAITEIRRAIHDSSGKGRGNMAFIPTYGEGEYYRLPFFERQGRELRDAFGFEVNKSGSASLKGFLAGLPNAGVLHLAAHGYSMFGSPSDNYVVMDSLDPVRPNLLTPYQLVDANTDAELAVLAICMGGISESNYQDVRNLAYWFSFAGAHSCLYSHWKLDDRSTSIILSRFYKNLSDGMGRYEALRSAQDEYLRDVRSDEERNPIYWAGLTMIGEDGPVDLARSDVVGGSRGWFFACLAGMAVVGGAIIYLSRRRASAVRKSVSESRPPF